MTRAAFGSLVVDIGHGPGVGQAAIAKHLPQDGSWVWVADLLRDLATATGRQPLELDLRHALKAMERKGLVCTDGARRHPADHQPSMRVCRRWPKPSSIPYPGSAALRRSGA